MFARIFLILASLSGVFLGSIAVKADDGGFVRVPVGQINGFVDNNASDAVGSVLSLGMAGHSVSDEQVKDYKIILSDHIKSDVAFFEIDEVKTVYFGFLNSRPRAWTNVILRTTDAGTYPFPVVTLTGKHDAVDVESDWDSDLRANPLDYARCKDVLSELKRLQGQKSLGEKTIKVTFDGYCEGNDLHSEMTIK